MLIKADEYTEKYMEDNPSGFPEASVDTIVDKIKARGQLYGNLQEYAVHLLKTLDKNNDGFVDLASVCEGLNGLGIYCSKHESHALLRRFDTHADGKVNMEELYNCLATAF